MSLDEVAVVAVHRADEAGETPGDSCRQAVVEPRRGGDQLQGFVVERGTPPGGLPNEQGFHRDRAFSPVRECRHGFRVAAFLAGFPESGSANKNHSK
jgi:hypothetical protein